METKNQDNKMQKINVMRNIEIEKLTLNVGAGKDQVVLNKGIKLIKSITGVNPVKTVTMKRIPTWGLRPGLPVGCKITLRGKSAVNLVPRLLDAKSGYRRKSFSTGADRISASVIDFIGFVAAIKQKSVLFKHSCCGNNGCNCDSKHTCF